MGSRDEEIRISEDEEIIRMNEDEVRTMMRGYLDHWILETGYGLRSSTPEEKEEQGIDRFASVGGVEIEIPITYMLQHDNFSFETIGGGTYWVFYFDPPKMVFAFTAKHLLKVMKNLEPLEKVPFEELKDQVEYTADLTHPQDGAVIGHTRDD